MIPGPFLNTAHADRDTLGVFPMLSQFFGELNALMIQRSVDLLCAGCLIELFADLAKGLIRDVTPCAIIQNKLVRCLTMERLDVSAGPNLLGMAADVLIQRS